jgi:hypothetical protein
MMIALFLGVVAIKKSAIGYPKMSAKIDVKNA